MMILPPEKVMFNSQQDIIDYVSRGLPPTQKEFSNLMERIQRPMTYEEIMKSRNKNENLVYIEDRLFMNIEKEQFENILNRVYENNVRNRNVLLFSIGVVSIGLIGGMLFHKRNDEDDDD